MPRSSICKLGGKLGFSLLEIMIAMAILSVGLLAFYGAQGNSLRASGRAENILRASQLAQQKMTEMLLEIDKDIQGGTLPDENANQSGSFDPPYEDYRWEFTVRKVELPLSGGGGEAGGENQEGAPPASNLIQAKVTQMVSRKIKETVREIKVKVLWEELGEEQSLALNTHIASIK